MIECGQIMAGNFDIIVEEENLVHGGQLHCLDPRHPEAPVCRLLEVNQRVTFSGQYRFIFVKDFDGNVSVVDDYHFYRVGPANALFSYRMNAPCQVLYPVPRADSH
ncbi:hypothetical protein D3C73_1339330 [compost metagenome]